MHSQNLRIKAPVSVTKSASIDVSKYNVVPDVSNLQLPVIVAAPNVAESSMCSNIVVFCTSIFIYKTVFA